MATDRYSSLPESVHQQLRSLNAQIRALVGIRGLGVGAAACAGVIAICVALDWLVELPGFVRFGLLGLFWLAAGYSVFRFLIQPLTQRFDTQELAAILEAGNPELEETVTSTIQLNDDSIPESERGSAWMRQQLTKQTAVAAADASASQAVTPGSSLRAVLTGVAAVAFLLMPFLFWPSSSQLMAQRFFMPWKNLDRPSNLYFEVPDGNRVIAHGSDATIVAIPKWRESESGEQPETVMVNWSFADGATGSKRMTWNEEQGGFVADIRAVVSEFDYDISSDSVRTRTYHIDTLMAPSIDTLLLDVDPPAYTGMAAKRHDGIISEVQAFEQSQLQFSITFNKPVEQAEFQWFDDSAQEGDEPKSTLLELSEDRTAASLRMSAETSGQFQIRLTDESGLTNEDATKRRLNIIEDRPPHVYFTEGAKKRVARPDDVIDVGISAEDDIGLGQLSLVYFIDEEEAGEIAFEDLVKGSQAAGHDFTIRLADLDIPVGVRFSYKGKAADERPPEPNVAFTSEKRELLIAADADSQAAQALSEEQEQIQKRITDIVERVEQDRKATKELEEAARDVARNNGIFNHDKELDELAASEEQLAQDLEDLSQELEKHPLYGEITEKAQEVARNELPEASAKQTEAARQPDMKQKEKDLRKAERALDTAGRKLRNLEQRFTELAKLEQGLAKLDDLAKDTEELADKIDDLEEKRQDAAAEQDEDAKAQKEQEVADKQAELQEQQQQLEQDLNDLADQNPELTEAAQQAQMDKMKELSERARELIEPEGHLANSFQNEANRNKSPARNTMQKARETQRQAEQLNRDLQKNKVPDGVDAEPIKQAVKELQRGNLEQPERAMREASESLQKKAQDIREGRVQPQAPQQQGQGQQQDRNAANAQQDQDGNQAEGQKQSQGQQNDQKPADQNQNAENSQQGQQNTNQSAGKQADGTKQNNDGTKQDQAQANNSRPQLDPQQQEQMARTAEEAARLAQEVAEELQKMRRQRQQAGSRTNQLLSSRGNSKVSNNKGSRDDNNRVSNNKGSRGDNSKVSNSKVNRVQVLWHSSSSSLLGKHSNWLS